MDNRQRHTEAERQRDIQSGHRQRSTPSPSQGPCVSLDFLLSSFVLVWFSHVFTRISESVFLLSVSLGSGATVDKKGQGDEGNRDRETDRQDTLTLSLKA